MSKRNVERIKVSQTNDYFANVMTKNSVYKFRVLDFNSFAMRLAPLKTAYDSLEIIDSVSIIYVNRIISTVTNPKILRKENDGVLVVSISDNAEIKIERQSSRLQVSPSFKPFLSAADPLQIDKTIHFELVDVSVKGLGLKTSLSNKNIIIGQVFENVSLFLPTIGEVKFSMEIKHIHYKTKFLYLGVIFIDIDKEKLSSIAKFSLFGTLPLVDESNLKNKLFQIKNNIVRIHELGPGIKIEVVNNQEDYNGVLKIRFKAYQKANKLSEGISSFYDFADDYDQRSIILIAKIDSYVAGTVRMVYCENDQKFPFEELLNYDDLDFEERTEFYEVSRLAIDPELQRSDILVKLFREVARITIVNEKTTLCFSTRILRPMYEKIGFATISKEAAHPVLKDEALALMKVDSGDFIFGAKMSKENWYKFSQDVVKNLEYGGFLPVNTVSTVVSKFSK